MYVVTRQKGSGLVERDYEIYKKKQGLRIRLARRIANITQDELAEKLTAELGFDFGDAAKVSRIEKGKQDLSGRELAAMSDVLDQPQPWLQGIDDEGMRAPIIHAPSSVPWFVRPIDIPVAA
jgi:transcriptional regulator with XRE-family HTH domain